MRSPLAIGLAPLALVSLVCGSLLIGSGRGILGHLPAAEVVIDECDLPGEGGTIRLYEGSVGAAGSSWYLATLQPGFFSAERTFFQAYGHPRVGAVACGEGTVDLIAEGDEAELSFSLERIVGELLDAPMCFDHGEAARGTPTGVAPRLMGVVCGSPLILLGGAAGLAVLRSRDGCAYASGEAAALSGASSAPGGSGESSIP